MRRRHGREDEELGLVAARGVRGSLATLEEGQFLAVIVLAFLFYLLARRGHVVVAEWEGGGIAGERQADVALADRTGWGEADPKQMSHQKVSTLRSF